MCLGQIIPNDNLDAPASCGVHFIFELRAKQVRYFGIFVPTQINV